MNTLRILVPTDFSEHSEHALVYAASLGERFGARIDLVHVITVHEHQGRRDWFAFPDLTPYLQRADAAARERLDAGAAHGGVAEATVKRVLHRGFNAYEAILDHAERETIDLIVMATRGNTGMRHAMLGSVAERVIRFSPCPVLVVEKGDRDFVDPETMAVRIKRIVFADNLDDDAGSALSRAIEWLRPYTPDVHLVHAVDANVPALYTMAGVQSIFEMHPGLPDRLGALLEERASTIVPADWTLNTVVREGNPHDIVNTYAKEVSADLIIVAGETHIDLQERVLGGTAERILRHAPCPVLVI